MTTTLDTVLTLEEAAEFLKVAPDTVTALLQSNELSGRKLEDEWRTTTRALLSLVDGVPLQMTCCTPSDCCTPAEGSSICCQPGDTGCC